MSTTEDILADTPVEPIRKPDVGDVGHFLISGFTYAESTRGSAGRVASRGQEFTVTQDLREAGTDRLGSCWLDLLHDPEGQRRRWGQVIFKPGPFPDGQLRTDPGSPEHTEARREAMREASSLPTKAERDAARREVERLYGPAVPTSNTLARYSDKK